MRGPKHNRACVQTYARSMLSRVLRVSTIWKDNTARTFARERKRALSCRCGCLEREGGALLMDQRYMLSLHGPSGAVGGIAGVMELASMQDGHLFSGGDICDV